MHVNVSGFNVDVQLYHYLRQLLDEYRINEPNIQRLKELFEKVESEPITPETLSAAYARISRSAKSIRELRRDSRASVNRARKSNEKIVFGLGHASIAEHAVFNLDITCATRLSLEEIESHRLASYTESSQRYISMSGDFHVPDEIREIGLADEFERLCKKLFRGYSDLTDFIVGLNKDMNVDDARFLALEDARYILPLCANSQVGVTVNARIAELMIKRFGESELSEIRALGKQMQEEIVRIAPSLIRYVSPNLKKQNVDKQLALTVEGFDCRQTEPEKEVELIYFSERAEEHVTAVLIFARTNCSFAEAMKKARNLDLLARKELLLQAHSYLNEHDSVRREMEFAEFEFAITLSSSAYAQLKRHRIASLVTQDYDPELGVTIPPVFAGTGGEAIMSDLISDVNELHYQIKENLKAPQLRASNYILTNAHRRRVVLKANARELMHISRLRQDNHAQWDIRNICNQMIEQAREQCPVLMQFACGKDKFEEQIGSIIKS